MNKALFYLVILISLGAIKSNFTVHAQSNYLIFSEDSLATYILNISDKIDSIITLPNSCPSSCPYVVGSILGVGFIWFEFVFFNHLKKRRAKDPYIKVGVKFRIAQLLALSWGVIAIFLSLPWLRDLSSLIGFPFALLIIAGIGYIPGYINSFMVFSLLFDRQPPLETANPDEEITVLIACRNEGKKIYNTLSYFEKQDYNGPLSIIVIDNGSTDNTQKETRRAKKDFKLNIKIMNEKNPGKFNALNKGLRAIKTELFLTLDADTLLHKSAIRYLVARKLSSPSEVKAVAGSVLTKNSRETFLARLQEWDYFLGIASVKRLQGLYQGTLVAQGAYSLYDTETIKKINGWPDAIGEDILLTWAILKNNNKVFYEPRAVAFTEVPITLKQLYRQRSRWARGMIEALKATKPWQHTMTGSRYTTSVNLFMPYLDFVYTFCFVPGIVLAFFGYYWIVGPLTLFVIPLALLINYILYKYQVQVFKDLDLRIRKNRIGFVVYAFIYQMIMSPISIIGYMQEFFSLKRKWK